MNLIPSPLSIKEKEGRFVINECTSISCLNPGALSVAERLAAEMRTPTGFPFPVSETAGTDNAIFLSITPNNPDLAEEGYLLEVAEKSAGINAATVSGLQHGTQTFLQLLPRQISARHHVPSFAAHLVAPETVLPKGWELPCWSAPCVEIYDRPRFSWRGFMLDCSRHFHQLDTLKWCIDLLVQLKMNRFHLHLSDNSGWRLQIPGWPLLTEKGSKTESDPRRQGFYTDDDIRQIVAYAAERNITVIPEIDVPGHTYAIVSSYPELSCFGKAHRNDLSHFHYLDILCAGSEKVDNFLEDAFNRVMDLFPSPHIHIGGDEAPKNRWRKCPKCAEQMKRKGLADVEELQGDFVNRVADIVRKRGRRPIAWDCVMGGHQKTDLIIHWWNDSRGLIAPLEAIRRGHDVICSRSNWNYFHAWEDQIEQFYSEARYLPSEFIGFREQRPEPYPDPEEWNKIIGAESCMWCEDTPSELLPARIFPAILANAELQWSYLPPEARDLGEFRKRLKFRRPTFERVQMLNWGG